MTEKLAIDGGAPIRQHVLPYGRQVIDDEDVRAVVDVLKGDWLTTGPLVAQFEEAVASYCGVKHAVAFNSCTAALHAACFAAGVETSTETIVPAMTFVATANAVLFCRGHVVFADVKTDSLLLDIDSLRARLSPRTRAVIAVDYAGQPADISELRALCDERGLKLIVDAAHSLGAKYRGGSVGQHAHFTAFSFHPVKSITTGEGGMAVTNDDRDAQRMRAFRSHGINSDPRARAERGEWLYEMAHLGYNYRIPDMLCALGVSQLRKLDSFIARRSAIASLYRKAFAAVPEIELLAELDDRTSSHHLFPIRINLDRLSAGRTQIFRALRAEGIGVNVHYIPVYWHPHYQRLSYEKGLCPIAEREYERLITLPLWAGMTDTDAKDVVDAVDKVIGAYRKS
jgi:perosamine synthetase